MNGGWHWVSCLEKRPTWRRPEDIDIIFSKLKTMKAFEHYPEDVLQELSRYVLYDTFLSNVTLFRPGEDSMYWYAVVTGALEMMDVDANDSSKTTSICQLRDGDSFGENVIFGTNRQTMIVTTEYCELLYVEAENMRRIYEVHKDVMERLLRLNSFEQQVSLNEADGSEHDECVPDSDLLVAGVTLHQLIKDHFSELFGDHKVNLFTYRQSCSGRRLVDWVLAQSSSPRTRLQVIQMWQALLAEGVMQHVHKEYPFRDEPNLLYQFVERRVRQEPRGARRWSSIAHDSGDGRLVNGRPRSISSVASSPRSSRSSVSSILDECFDTIASLGPEVLIFATLRKRPSDRTPEDTDLIYDELLHVRAFRHLSNAVTKEIAACVKLEHFKQAGKYLFRQGDKGDSWYIILKGSVNVIIRGKGVVCTLHEGDEFGKLAVVNEAVRSATVQVREDNSYFLRIERDDFRRILFSVESTTMKFMEHGREVLLLEKASLGRYLVVKGTPDKMLDHLLESEIEEGSQEDCFARDFFLTYPAFMSTMELCEGLKRRFHHQVPRTPSLESHTASAADQEKLKKRRIADAVCIWINTTKAELVKDHVFQRMLRELQDNLTKDGLLDQLAAINISLADSIRGSQANSPAPSSFGMFKSRKASSVTQEHEIKMGICVLPPCQPQDKVSLRVHTVEHTCCRLQVRLDSCARDIINEACEKLDLPADKYGLCEVKSSGEKVELRDNDVSVHSEMSVNGRLYIVPRSHSERILPPLPDQNQKPVSPFPDKESSREIAAHLTLYDWNLFSNIQQMEFIYQLFGRHKFGKITTNLDLLIRRFNEVQFWVVTEICREQELVKRVALLKKFIKIAGYCKSFNDLNSFFAVTIGLMNGAVTRLKLTWKELPFKLRRRLNQFESLTDPSRNHKVLRAYQSKLPPPIVPFMPLVMKDAFFLHEGNVTYVDDLVNFEKMRLVASKVRGLNAYRSVGLPTELKVLANKNPALQQYFRSLRVIDNVQLLTQMSHKVEPSANSSSNTDRPLSSVS